MDKTCKNIDLFVLFSEVINMILLFPNVGRVDEQELSDGGRRSNLDGLFRRNCSSLR